MGKVQYRHVKQCLRPIVGSLCSIQLEGEDNLPKEEGFIIASNHLTFLDPFVLSVRLSEQISFGAKTDLFNIPGLRTLLEWTEQIPLQREGMTRAEFKKLIATAKSRMDRGIIFGLFPEGTRSKDGRMLDFESGVVLIAAKTGRPTVPVGITYSFSWRRPRLHVHIRIGEPLESADYTMREFKHELERRVAALSGQERAYRRRLKKNNFPKAA